MTSFTAIREWSGNDGLALSFAFTLLTDCVHLSWDGFIDFTTECLNFKVPGNKKGLLTFRRRASSV